MKKIKILFQSLAIALLPVLLSSQTQIFYDEASFLNALDPYVASLEDYENCPTFDGFTLTGGICDGIFLCNSGDGSSYEWSSLAEFNFDAPKNAFGTFLYGVGSAGSATVVLETNDGQMYTAASGSEPGNTCNDRFFGIISETSFTRATFTNTNGGDPVSFDNTYCADTLTPIPTLSQWGFIVLAMIMLIFGVVAVRRRMLT